MDSDIKHCTAALLDEWRIARRAPSQEAAELHYQLTLLYNDQLVFLRRQVRKKPTQGVNPIQRKSYRNLLTAFTSRWL